MGLLLQAELIWGISVEVPEELVPIPMDQTLAEAVVAEAAVLAALSLWTAV